jgi:hypothetical protein
MNDGRGFLFVVKTLWAEIFGRPPHPISQLFYFSDTVLDPISQLFYFSDTVLDAVSQLFFRCCFTTIF